MCAESRNMKIIVLTTIYYTLGMFEILEIMKNYVNCGLFFVTVSRRGSGITFLSFWAPFWGRFLRLGDQNDEKMGFQKMIEKMVEKKSRKSREEPWKRGGFPTNLLRSSLG